MRRGGGDRPGTARGRRLWLPALTVLLGLLAGLLLAEGLLRVADRLGWIPLWREAREARRSSIWTASSDPELLYRHRPGYVKDGRRVTERHGILRTADVEPAAPPGTLRLTVLGDSITAALSLPAAQRWPAQVERALTAHLGAPAEVLNFAVNGYSTTQEAALLEGLAGRFDTHGLILQYCFNDLHPSATPGRWFQARRRLRLADLAGLVFGRRFEYGYPPASYWQRRYRHDGAGWRSVVAGFGRIAAHAERREIPALLVVFPLLSREGWWAGDAAARHARVAAAARESGFEVLDLLEVYARHPVEALRLAPWDTFHPNPRGQRLAAEAVVERLLAGGLPGRVDPSSAPGGLGERGPRAARAATAAR